MSAGNAALDAHLVQAGDRVSIVRGKHRTTARDLRARIASLRTALIQRGVEPGDRVALVGANTSDWIAADLAIAFAGAVPVPFYERQAVADVAAMVADCTPRLLLGDAHACARFAELSIPCVAFDACQEDSTPAAPTMRAPHDAARLVYTSGTSGRAKGAILTNANIEFMLPQTNGRLDQLLRGCEDVRAFHYLPFCFAGSWVLLQTILRRHGELHLCEKLDRLGDEMRKADPHTVLHVPLVLERVRRGIVESVAKRGGLTGWLWRQAWMRRVILAPRIRRALAPSLKGFICGSAPLAPATQRFFMMLGMPVLQVYGLTETTAICTMDEPDRVVAGAVGRAIDGCAMRVDKDGVIEVSGPHVFSGYWGQPPHDGWFATGDSGSCDAEGRWTIGGRHKDIIVLAGGHNVAPEPLELALQRALPDAAQVVLFGHGKPHLVALVTGPVPAEHIESVLQDDARPHYERVRRFLTAPPLTPESGLLTANGKLRRNAIEQHFASRIEELYA